MAVQDHHRHVMSPAKGSPAYSIGGGLPLQGFFRTERAPRVHLGTYGCRGFRELAASFELIDHLS